jgi:hypothetical protein
MYQKTWMCFGIAFLIFISTMFATSIITANAQQVNVTGTPYESKYNTEASITSVVLLIMYFVGVMFFIAGVGYAFSGKRR